MPQLSPSIQITDHYPDRRSQPVYPDHTGVNASAHMLEITRWRSHVGNHTGVNASAQPIYNYSV